MGRDDALLTRPFVPLGTEQRAGREVQVSQPASLSSPGYSNRSSQQPIGNQRTFHQASRALPDAEGEPWGPALLHDRVCPESRVLAPPTSLPLSLCLLGGTPVGHFPALHLPII